MCQGECRGLHISLWPNPFLLSLLFLETWVTLIVNCFMYQMFTYLVLLKNV